MLLWDIIQTKHSTQPFTLGAHASCHFGEEQWEGVHTTRGCWHSHPDPSEPEPSPFQDPTRLKVLLLWVVLCCCTELGVGKQGNQERTVERGWGRGDKGIDQENE